MDNAAIVKKFLADNRGRFFCNQCISQLAGITNPNQVNQLTRPLRDVKPYRGGTLICSTCGKERECIAYD
jgi:hypothetical protein